MMNEIIDSILSNISIEEISKLIGSEEIRTFNGKKLKQLNDDVFYMSIRKFGTYSRLRLHSGVLTSFMHNTIPNCIIVRMTKNVSYILLRIDNGKLRIVLQNELNEEQMKEYERRCK